jgi:Nuclease-related domain
MPRHFAVGRFGLTTGGKLVTLIPDKISPDTNFGEKVLFEAFEGIQGHDDWIVLHGLHQYKVVQGVETEGDFIVLMPGKGIVVIESKGARSAVIDGETWTLVGVPEKAKNKSPVEQAEHVRNNIKALINTNDINAAALPIARVVWFPKMDPLEFDGVGNKGMEFYSWEILFRRDIKDIGRVLVDAISAETKAGPDKGRKYTPELFDDTEMVRIKDILRIRAKAEVTKDGVSDIRRVQLNGATDYLKPIWDSISRNNYFYIEGAAGSGKSVLLKYAADSYAAEGRKVLVTCNGIMMADELSLYFEHQPNVDVIDLGNLFLQTAQLKSHKKGDSWYQEELPIKAKNALMHNPHLAKYDVICVDEFQDIAAFPDMVDAVFRYFGGEGDFAPGIVVAGDDYQQILNSKGHVSGFETAEEALGDKFVRINLNRNCRQAPGLSHAIYNFLGWDDRGYKHQLNKDIEWSFEIVRPKPGKETDSLAEVVRNLLETNEPSQIRVLSAFGEKQSLLAELFHRESKNNDERWLKKQLVHRTTQGEIRWRSIPKFKGLDQDVIVITDIGNNAVDFAKSINQTLNNLLYVGLTRAKFQVVLMISDGLFPNARSSRN